MKFAIDDSELRWLEKLFSERFGSAWILKKQSGSIELRHPALPGRVLFDRKISQFENNQSDLSCGSWDPREEGWDSVLNMPLVLPGARVLEQPLIEKLNDGYVVHYDVLGLTFWVLNRIEEINRGELDTHSRFCGNVSHAYQHGYLDRPIIDEWLHLVRQIMIKVWPAVDLKSSEYRVEVSHDIDIPFLYFDMHPTVLGKIMLADLIKRLDFRLALSRYADWQKVNRGDLSADPFNSLAWLMEQSDLVGLKNRFYFKAGYTNSRFDTCYEITKAPWNDLVRLVIENGHSLGLHPSYSSQESESTMFKEIEKYKTVCGSLGLSGLGLETRMHYLKWSHPNTLVLLDSLGVKVDSTMLYPEHSGFRCGTCFEYPAFDPVGKRELNIRIKPLLMMDQQLGLESGREESDALTDVRMINERVRSVGGVFTILWHNSSVSGREFLYRKILSLIA